MGAHIEKYPLFVELVAVRLLFLCAVEVNFLTNA